MITPVSSAIAAACAELKGSTDPGAHTAEVVLTFAESLVKAVEDIVCASSDAAAEH